MATTSILMSIQDVLGNNIYQIPDYQRGYAWEETQIKDLLEDLENVENGKTHYTGTMVIVKKGEKRQFGESFTIYDGVCDKNVRGVARSIFLRYNLLVVALTDKEDRYDREHRETSGTKKVVIQGVGEGRQLQARHDINKLPKMRKEKLCVHKERTPRSWATIPLEYDDQG